MIYLSTFKPVTFNPLNRSCDDEKHSEQEQETCQRAGAPNDEGEYTFAVQAIKI
jgi:hypothetical protein